MSDEAHFHLGAYRTFLWPDLEDMDVDDVYFQQDGATCHTSDETIGLLRQKFPVRVISRNGDCNWPPRSCGSANVAVEAI